MNETRFKAMRDMPSAHLLGAGTAMCAGCGGLEAVHQIYDVLGEDTVIVNAAGCMSLLSIYPFTPFRGSWLYSSMASSPAGAQGIRDALNILKDKNRITDKDDLQVATLIGDGAAYGIGLSATSSAIERDLDFLYVCYDNEGYGNTGQQTSGATPHGAQTSTATGESGYPGFKKDLFAILAAHNPAYVATIIGSEPLDLAPGGRSGRRAPEVVADDQRASRPDEPGARLEEPGGIRPMDERLYGKGQIGCWHGRWRCAEVAFEAHDPV